MVTMYPILISLGVSRNGATGPSSGNTVLAAKTAELQTVDYFVTYQLPVAIAVTLAIAITHYFVQRWFDKKYEGGLATGVRVSRNQWVVRVKKSLFVLCGIHCCQYFPWF